MAEVSFELVWELSVLHDLTSGVRLSGLQLETHEPCSAWGQSPVLSSDALLSVCVGGALGPGR